MTLVRVIGCGNPDAGDDAAGMLAVRDAREALEAISGVEVVPQASPLEVVHLLEGADAALVVDAIRTPGGRRQPGTLVRAELGAGGTPAELRSSLSSHGLGLAEAFGLAGAIGPTPRLVVIGVEVVATAAGTPISQAVEDALPRLTEMVVAEARALASAERTAAEGPTGPIRAEGPGRTMRPPTDIGGRS